MQAWQSWREGRATDIVDPTINNGSQNEIMRCIHIGLLCVQDNIAARPTMASVLHVLNSHSCTLPLPLEPAFYVDSRTENLPDIQLWEFNSRTIMRIHNYISSRIGQWGFYYWLITSLDFDYNCGSHKHGRSR